MPGNRRLEPFYYHRKAVQSLYSKLPVDLFTDMPYNEGQIREVCQVIGRKKEC